MRMARDKLPLAYKVFDQITGHAHICREQSALVQQVNDRGIQVAIQIRQRKYSTSLKQSTNTQKEILLVQHTQILIQVVQ